MMHYAGGHTVYLLNDGYVAKKENWHEMEDLAKRLEAEGLNVHCITRTRAGGAKAGNINYALSHTKAPLVAIFDADHVPHADFLEKTVPYFGVGKVGFVQTPQYYKNFATNYLTQGSWEQQELFFGPICRGKNRLNAATMCGTNMVIAREALANVGGMCTESIAEDFVTGLFMHEQGYTSVYHPEVLAEGLAAEDFLSYSKQQFRWARGALDVIFSYNPLFRSGLSWAQRIQYLASASFYLSGLIVAIDIMLPIIFLFTGAVPILAPGMLLATIFLPYMFVTLYCIERSSNFTFTFPSLGLSMSAFTIHLRALWAAATRTKSEFAVTSKEALGGNFVRLASVHIIYIVIAAIGMGVAFAREGVSASLINNVAWAGLNIAVFVPFIRSALPQRASKAVKAKVPLPAPQPSYATPH
jgi:cellulose synthase (UDP-forming)